jgi:predicted ArsR family transcriptional regulator
MHTIKTSTGAAIALDGDLLAILETLYQEVTVKRALDRTFEDMVKEIRHLMEQMDERERLEYLAESLFLNAVTYENDKLEAYLKRLSKK